MRGPLTAVALFALVATGLGAPPHKPAAAEGSERAAPELTEATVSVAPLPATAHPGDPRVTLNDVACTEDGTCFAVGSFRRSDSRERALVETLHNGEWSATELPLPRDAKSTSSPALAAISCWGASRCAAVGAYRAGRRGPQPMVATWDGSSWSVRSPRLPAGAVGLNVDPLVDVSCGGPRSCVAVGTYVSRQRTAVPLVVTLRAGRWRSEAGPLPPHAQSGELWAVDCAASRACVAIGASEPRVAPGAATPQHPLAEVLSGRRWRAERPPVPRVARKRYVGSILRDVSCAKEGRCAAVGTYAYRTRGTVRNKGLVTVLKAGRWRAGSVEPRPGAARHAVVLEELTCPAGRACVGVGTHAAVGGKIQPAVARISGTEGAGSSVLPDGARQSGLLADVACGSSACVGVGYVQGRGLVVSVRGDDVSYSYLPGETESVLRGVAMQSAVAGVAVGTTYGQRQEGLLVTGIDAD